MPIYELNDQLVFPPPEKADPDGLLAFGGDLDPDRLLIAYRMGIFPWFNPGDPILWWSPDPRMVLYPSHLHVSKDMRRILRKGQFSISYDNDFRAVITACKDTPRKDQSGTWITDEMQKAYEELHKRGYAHSVEVWQEGELVGGLYGVSLGGCFFGESMFSKVSNASKTGLITFVRDLVKNGFQMIDCQVYTDHLASLGAE
ncbi:MAG: leucyl/phenylalanyl-tRNA--protein transferase, partial [Bacteroidetes bacterium SW_11_45_7]